MLLSNVSTQQNILVQNMVKIVFTIKQHLFKKKITIQKNDNYKKTSIMH